MGKRAEVLRSFDRLRAARESEPSERSRLTEKARRYGARKLCSVASSQNKSPMSLTGERLDLRSEETSPERDPDRRSRLGVAIEANSRASAREGIRGETP
tara:strand:+ start:1570 stop:1869 length:300 start_codon:yes stop_codon:yes gene_type:complete